jgi:hypothetical protein
LVGSVEPQKLLKINCYSIIKRKKKKEDMLHRMNNSGDNVNSNGVDLNAANESAASLVDRSIQARIKYSYSGRKSHNKETILRNKMNMPLGKLVPPYQRTKK